MNYLGAWLKSQPSSILPYPWPLITLSISINKFVIFDLINASAIQTCSVEQQYPYKLYKGDMTDNYYSHDKCCKWDMINIYYSHDKGCKGDVINIYYSHEKWCKWDTINIYYNHDLLKRGYDQYLFHIQCCYVNYCKGDMVNTLKINTVKATWSIPIVVITVAAKKNDCPKLQFGARSNSSPPSSIL